MGTTWRATQKANRRVELLRRAAELFAQRGFAGVSTGELGDAVGMSGPALYNYFPSKEALLSELLEDASMRLLAGCREIMAMPGTAGETLERLVAFHIDFATSEPDVIRVQDRELAQLPAEANHHVRSLQRQYVQEWDVVLAALRPQMDALERSIRLLATFGLLNSTPHSAAASRERARQLLAEMAEGSLLGHSPGGQTIRSG
ncbi:MAG: TetR/AcrR family transcriptional regulator [Actinobacteria bacterium]|nr:TetR/AcrR family transcriptional regulator [Actinomycetota bacterium]